MSVSEILLNKIGQTPKDAIGWLYVSRGYYEIKNYDLCMDSLQFCLRNAETKREAQHLLSWCLYHTKQYKQAAAAFYKSIEMGNQVDWQPFLELCIDHQLVFTEK